MIGVKSYSEKALAALPRCQAALDRSVARLAAHERAKPAGDDADALYGWKRERRDLEDRIDADQDALAFAEQRAEEARKEETERQAAAEHAAEERRAAADTKIVRKIGELSHELKGALGQLEESRKRTDAVNSRRGARAYIADAEFRVRQSPGELVPEVVDEQELTVDKDGGPVADTVWDRGLMKYVRNPAAVGRGIVRNVIREAVWSQPTMDGRLADKFTLVDLAGKQIWPERSHGSY